MSAEVLPRCPRCRSAKVQAVNTSAPILLHNQIARLHSFNCGACRFRWQKWAPARKQEVAL